MATKALPPINTTDDSKSWKGFTLEDIRYRRAINTVKMEIEKERLMSETTQLVGNTTQGLFTSATVRKLFSGFSYLDYGVLASQVFRQIQKVFRLFRR